MEKEAYEEREEDPKPGNDELEYLKQRQNLKETIRRKMRKESGAILGQFQEKNKLPSDNYGSFFGPSQPVIAQRVIQERKAMLLEVQHLPSRASKPHHSNKRSPVSTAAERKPGLLELKMKAQKLRDNRDYSFLFSDNAELPAPPAKEPLPRKVCVSNSADQVPFKNKQSMRSFSKKVPRCLKEKKHDSMFRQLQPSAVPNKVALPNRLSLTFSNLKKQLGSSSGNGVHRPAVQKGLPDKRASPKKFREPNYKAKVMPNQLQYSSKHLVPDGRKASLLKSQAVTKQHLEEKKEFPDRKKAKVVPNKLQFSSKHLVPDGRKASLPKSQPVTKQHLEGEKEFPDLKMAKVVPNELPSSSKYQIKSPEQEHRDEYDSDDGDIFGWIRGMFRYNPKKYRSISDDDIAVVESNFDDIQEEERKSEKIARKEDERELLLIEQEERLERFRKEVKKRKLHDHR